MHNSLKISLISAFLFYTSSKPLRENKNGKKYIQKDCETLLLILLSCEFRTTYSFSYGLEKKTDAPYFAEKVTDRCWEVIAIIFQVQS